MGGSGTAPDPAADRRPLATGRPGRRRMSGRRPGRRGRGLRPGHRRPRPARADPAFRVRARSTAARFTGSRSSSQAWLIRTIVPATRDRARRRGGTSAPAAGRRPRSPRPPASGVDLEGLVRVGDAHGRLMRSASDRRAAGGCIPGRLAPCPSHAEPPVRPDPAGPAARAGPALAARAGRDALDADQVQQRAAQRRGRPRSAGPGCRSPASTPRADARGSRSPRRWPRRSPARPSWPTCGWWSVGPAWQRPGGARGVAPRPAGARRPVRRLARRTGAARARSSPRCTARAVGFGGRRPRALEAAAAATARGRQLPRERREGERTVAYDLRPFLETRRRRRPARRRDDVSDGAASRPGEGRSAGPTRSWPSSASSVGARARAPGRARPRAARAGATAGTPCPRRRRRSRRPTPGRGRGRPSPVGALTVDARDPPYTLRSRPR